MSHIKRYLEQADISLQKGTEAESIKDYNLAADSFLDASEFLFLAAALSPDEMKSVRVENAEKILRHAVGLENQKAQEQMIKDNPDYAKGLALLEELSLKVVHSTKISFNDVAGLDRVKNEIVESVIWPIEHPVEAEMMDIQPGGGVLLYGPPGTGKTHISKAIATEVNMSFIEVKTSNLVDQWFGKFEKNIQKVFEAAKLCSPSVLFFDEVEAIATDRSKTRSSVMKRAVPELLNQFGSIGDNKNHTILILGATNVPWGLDPAILRPGRFGEKIYVSPPDLRARIRLFELGLKNQDTSMIEFELCGLISDGYSGADITFICEKVRKTVFRNIIELGEKRQISIRDIEEAVEAVSKSITQDMIDKYEKYRSAHS